MLLPSALFRENPTRTKFAAKNIPCSKDHDFHCIGSFNCKSIGANINIGFLYEYEYWVPTTSSS